jgi:UDP-N-acetylglucosamine--N-acetylmuramyl-(pentapeptide) pyrophosphoryl-undecaprenol N-acetylglucosamine transferase
MNATCTCNATLSERDALPLEGQGTGGRELMTGAASARATALVMAGGTGGHIFPGLAVAEALRDRAWRVHWLGAPGSMESRLVPPRGFPLETVEFGGVRGKGLKTLLLLPLRLAKAFAQSVAVMRRVRPDVVIGLGGYITFPGGVTSVLLGKPLVLHEQNSIAGLANRVLATMAARVFTAFPNVIGKGDWIGNPLRAAFLAQPGPAERFAGRSGPLRVLVVGGSLGAKALNDIVPKALALLPPAQRPASIKAAPSRSTNCAPTTRPPACRPNSRPSSTTPPARSPTPIWSCAARARAR